MPESRILMGVVGRPHGVRGLVRVHSYTADPADLPRYAPLEDDAGRVWKLAWRGEGVAELRGADGKPVADRTAAAALVNTRLYVPRDRFDVFRASADRLASFAKTHPIRALLGAHIEMTTTPGQDYPMQASAHPSEHGLALPPSAIDQLDKAVTAAPSPSAIDRHADFIVYPVAPKPA